MTQPGASSSLVAKVRQFWRVRVLGLVVAQLQQGCTPRQVAFTAALGLCLGVFPIFGATSLLCLACGVGLKLNQPFIQLINWLASPLQLLLIPVFVRLGEMLVGANRVSFSIPQLFAQFHASPAQFFRDFGLTGWHGILGWSVAAPLAGSLLYRLFLPLTQQLDRQLPSTPGVR